MYKTVLITGASRGIGRAIACAFAREGCRLVINCSHSEKELLALADELRETCHVDVLTSIGDVSDYTYMEQLFSQSEARFGGVDILVNNAGIVYENVNAAEAGFALGEKLFHIGIVRYVADAGEYVHMAGFP